MAKKTVMAKNEEIKTLGRLRNVLFFSELYGRDTGVMEEIQE